MFSRMHRATYRLRDTAISPRYHIEKYPVLSQQETAQALKIYDHVREIKRDPIKPTLVRVDAMHANIINFIAKNFGCSAQALCLTSERIVNINARSAPVQRESVEGMRPLRD
jgi:hypothetical protein